MPALSYGPLDGNGGYGSDPSSLADSQCFPTAGPIKVLTIALIGSAIIIAALISASTDTSFQQLGFSESKWRIIRSRVYEKKPIHAGNGGVTLSAACPAERLSLEKILTSSAMVEKSIKGALSALFIFLATPPLSKMSSKHCKKLLTCK